MALRLGFFNAKGLSLMPRASKEVKDEVKAANVRVIREYENARRDKERAPGDPKREAKGDGLSRLETTIAGISNQQDILRKAFDRAKVDLVQPKLTPASQISETELLTTERFNEEMEKLQAL
ncbi:hypothetical protein HW555_005070, partial [Spodoptera exigua]